VGVPAADAHAAATSGYPFGGCHPIGASPVPSTSQYRSSRPFLPLRSGPSPSARTVATMSCIGRRIFVPPEPRNSGDANSSFSTGTIADRPRRYTTASRATSAGGGVSATKRTHSLYAICRAVAGCRARWSRNAIAAFSPPAAVALGWVKPRTDTGPVACRSGSYRYSPVSQFVVSPVSNRAAARTSASV
jgi:hypothetical protein